MSDNSKNFSLWLSRFAIFLVYFWFGALKVFGASPASPLVLALLDRTIPFIPESLFMILLGLFEMLIGVLFLIPQTNRLGIYLLGLHIILASLPLFILSTLAWSGFLVPTLEGQYMVKNILTIAIAVYIYREITGNPEKVYV